MHNEKTSCTTKSMGHTPGMSNALITEVAAFECLADGIRAEVYLSNGRYGVRLLDLDATEVVGGMRFYPDRERAVAYAKSLITA